jgi:hypothetical protein
VSLNPSGLCMCGCGQPAPLAKQTHRAHGYVKGEPIRYINGHNIGSGRSHRDDPDQPCECGCGRITNRDRVGKPRRFIKGHDKCVKEPHYVVDPETGCWLWQHAIADTGYGVYHVNGKPMGAHRWMYEQHSGPIPAGLHIDHVRERGCVHRHCVNPAHMEAVPCVVNVRRGAAPKLTFELAEQIRAKHAGGALIRDLAAEHGVSQRTIRSLLQGRTWRALTAA